MNATEQLLLAGYMGHEVKRASTMRAIGRGALDFGLDMLPGVGTYRMGRRAFQDFGQGNWLGGVGNLIGAGATLIPGFGGAAGKGISAAARLGSKALTRIGAPTLSKGLGAAGKGLAGVSNAVGGVSDRIAPAVGKGIQTVAQRMPTLGGKTISSGVGVAGNAAKVMSRNPGATGAVVGGANLGLGAAGAGAMEAKMMAGQQQGGMQDLMQNWRSRMPTTNPMMAGGGMNPNYQFA